MRSNGSEIFFEVAVGHDTPTAVEPRSGVDGEIGVVEIVWGPTDKRITFENFFTEVIEEAGELADGIGLDDMPERIG